MLRSLKKKRDDKIRVAISKETLQSSKDTYWSKVDSIRKNNFNSTSVIDGHTGDINIVNHFQNKFSHLYNSVPTATMKLNSLSECISSKIELLYNSAIKDNDLHCHVVSKNDVFIIIIIIINSLLQTNVHIHVKKIYIYNTE